MRGGGRLGKLGLTVTQAALATECECTMMRPSRERGLGNKSRQITHTYFIFIHTMYCRNEALADVHAANEPA